MEAARERTHLRVIYNFLRKSIKMPTVIGLKMCQSDFPSENLPSGMSSTPNVTSTL